jgi:hypothetical protein
MVQPFVSRLRTQYFSLYPARWIAFPPISVIQLATNQSELVDCLLEDVELKAYQPARDYQRVFWKLVVGRLEEELRVERAVENELVNMGMTWEGGGCHIVGD